MFSSRLTSEMSASSHSFPAQIQQFVSEFYHCTYKKEMKH